MTKPTKTQLIKLRDESYREQPVQCCGTCKHFRPLFAREIVGTCDAVTVRWTNYWMHTKYLGKCDLYESIKDGAK